MKKRRKNVYLYDFSYIYIKYLWKDTKNLIALVVCRSGNGLAGMRTEKGERLLTVYSFIYFLIELCKLSI